MSKPNQSPGPRPSGRIAAALLASVAAGGLLIAYGAHGSLPYNAIKLPYEKQVRSQMWFPQGWKFFTRDAQEERFEVLAHRPGGWRSALAGTNSAPGNWFGADRRGRAQGVEVGLLIDQVGKKAWRECEVSPTSCLEQAPIEARIDNVTPRPSICGEVGIVMQKPVPWAWASSKKAVTMPSRVVRVTVQC